MQAQTSHLPFKVNMAGVIPAIFASTFLLFPSSISAWFGENDSSGFLASFSLALEPGQPLYIIVFAGLIISFCFINVYIFRVWVLSENAYHCITNLETHIFFTTSYVAPEEVKSLLRW